ncbi:NUDIX domain-containing protein [Winkia neuii]|uniref:NUDIX hydrolase n=1 Tax=Winkia neuii subsp. anitrata TaxID=29318 RepID=A0AB38XRS8_9ACTO|nr:NUDIX hydrolase [Winkia neuii]MBS5948364.1 NUDIX hydrolase [Winkia neuii]MDU2270082.1 NUDIX hydrolase [Winkia neuii]MDU5162601.1 NUDIX hydrolase [Winkia neuii]WCE46981.1 NUDIX hydrolase [Winkia neuii subsp. anitrata]
MLSDAAEQKRVLESSRPWQGAVFGIRTDSVDFGDVIAKRDYLDHPGAVCIVALRNELDPEICLIKQYRHPIRATLWEIPAGLTDVEGETLLEAAKRELAEEVGLAASQWDTLVDLFSSPGCSNERLRVFLARGISSCPAPEGFVKEAEEAELELRWVKLTEVLQEIFSGSIHNPSTVTGVLAASAAVEGGFQSLRSPDDRWCLSRDSLQE